MITAVALLIFLHMDPPSIDHDVYMKTAEGIRTWSKCFDDVQLLKNKFESRLHAMHATMDWKCEEKI